MITVHFKSAATSKGRPFQGHAVVASSNEELPERLQSLHGAPMLGYPADIIAKCQYLAPKWGLAWLRIQSCRLTERTLSCLHLHFA